VDLQNELDSYKTLVEREIWRYLDSRKEPEELYGPLRDLFKRGGKRVRPMITLLSCEAVGGRKERALKTAAAIEMVHNFTLIHDDIADMSELRRGKPCLHRVYGDALAINAADGLFSLAYEVLCDNYDILPQETTRDIFRILSGIITRVCEGQATDISWSKKHRFDISEQDYFEMLRLKTGALISGCCETGAIAGRGSDEQIKALGEFGMSIGIAFQIHDDVLNLSGSVEKYGKEIGGDINEGKRTLIVIYALGECNPAERKRLIDILDKTGNSQEEIREALSIIKKHGSIQRASDKASEIVEKGKKRLDVLPDSRSKELLLALADYFVKREL
jgi:geranylgeranyl diphosphate synthase type I